MYISKHIETHDPLCKSVKVLGWGDPDGALDGEMGSGGGGGALGVQEKGGGWHRRLGWQPGAAVGGEGEGMGEGSGGGREMRWKRGAARQEGGEEEFSLIYYLLEPITSS